MWLYQSSFDIRSRRVDFSVPKSRYCRKTKLLERGGGCAAQMRTLGVSAHHSKALQCIYLLPAIFVMIIPASAPVSAITACSPTSIFSIHFLLWARQFHWIGDLFTQLFRLGCRTQATATPAHYRNLYAQTNCTLSTLDDVIPTFLALSHLRHQK